MAWHQSKSRTERLTRVWYPVRTRATLPRQDSHRCRGRSGSAPFSFPLLCVVGLLLALAGPTQAADPPLPDVATNTQVFIVTNTAFAGGAYGNGQSNSAAAINAAITWASGHGGGIVEIPPVTNGVTFLTNYLSGPITMAAHVNLQIDSGAKLQMFPLSTWEPNYGTTSFIEVGTLTDAEISGSGTIDGQGLDWWNKYPSNTGARPHFIQIDKCTRVLIRDINLQNPPVFTIYMKNGNDTSVTIDHIRIDTPPSPTSHNTDGFDISATNVLIRNSFISTGDDNVEIGGSNPTRDITISNCVFGTGHGVSMGSIVSGGVIGMIVSNCTWVGTEYGIKGKSDMDRGGTVDNIHYSDLTMTNVGFAISFYSYYNTVGSPSDTFTFTPQNASTITDSGTLSPSWQNITIRNVTVSNITANVAGFFWGLPSAPINNVTLTNVNIISSPTKTLCMYNVRGINIVDSNLTAPNSSTNTFTLYNAQFTVTNSAPTNVVMTITGLGSPSNSVLSLFNGQAGMGNASVLGANPLLTLASSTLTVSNAMSVGSSSSLNFGLGTNVTQTVVTGNLTLGGTLNVADFGGFTNTTYNLFTYGGTLAYNGLTVGTKPNASFTYTVSTNTAHQVNLIVSDGGVSMPTASFTGNPTSGTAPLPVTFTDSSTGSITNWFWSFGDGNTTNFTVATNPAHTYAAGTYTVGLTVSGTGGSNTLTRSNYIVATNPPPPTASFSGTPTTGAAPLPVTFTDSSTGSITNRFWNFGDGNTTNFTVSTNPAHTYAAGTYTVSLIVSGTGGSSTNTQSNYIVAINPPVAGFSGNPTSGTAPLPVTFTDSSTGSITNWLWNFGDGNSTNFTVSTNPVHTYAAGTYTVRLTVSGAVGSSTNTQSNYIVVTNPPPPVAVFSGNPTNGTAPLGVTFTDNSTGSITNWLWNFGDGTKTNFTVSTNPVHTYAAGTYTVSLTVSGLGGSNTNTLTSYIVALNPAHLVVNPASLNLGSATIGQTNSLNFSVINSGDVSLSGTAASAAPFVVISPPNGGYNDLAGGQTTTVTVAFAPGSAATFNGSVIFTSDGGNSTNAVSGVGLTPGSIAVTPATLDFGTLATGTTAQASFVVTNSGGTAVSNGMSTVDGGPFTIVSGGAFSLPGFGTTNVVVQFAPVTLDGFTNAVIVATANGGTATNTVSGTGADLPVASFSATPTVGPVPLTVNFTDNSTGTIDSNFWDFGDGGTTNFAAPTNVQYTYANPGVYTVTLIASNSDGISTLVSNNLITAMDPYTWWASNYFGCATCPQAQPNADPLGKGMSNTNQFLAGVNPTNGASALRIISAVRQTTDVLVTWTTAGGRTNAVQATTGGANGSYTTNFVDITAWPHIIIDGSGDVTTNYVDIGGATNTPSRFYRIRLVP